MNIAKALKVKNRLTGEITRLQEQFQASNKYDTRNPSGVTTPSPEVWNTLYAKINSLIELKTKIATANLGIIGKIELLSQLKSLLTQIDTLDTTESYGVRKDPYVAANTETYDILCWIKDVDKQSIRNSLQNQINDTQDLLDEYNAATEI